MPAAQRDRVFERHEGHFYWAGNHLELGFLPRYPPCLPVELCEQVGGGALGAGSGRRQRVGCRLGSGAPGGWRLAAGDLCLEPDSHSHRQAQLQLAQPAGKWVWSGPDVQAVGVSVHQLMLRHAAVLLPVQTSGPTPPLQAVTGYRLEVAGAGALTNIRDAFVAAAGCTLLSADYSQASGGW